jgi:hypothetical protein
LQNLGQEVELRPISFRRKTHQGATFAEGWVLKVLPLSLCLQQIQQIQQIPKIIHQSVPLASGFGTVLCRLEGTWLVVH